MTAASVLSKRDHRHNDLTTELDVAIRHLNRSKAYAATGDDLMAKHYRNAAGVILEEIGPELLMIDPEAIQ